MTMKKVQEPGDEPPPPRPREVRPSSIRPGAEAVRLHILTHCPYQSWCEVCVASKGKSDHYHREASQRAKTDECGVEMAIRFLSTYESVEVKTDGEPSIVEIARRVQARRDRTTTLAQTSVGGHQEIGAMERANGTVQAPLRAYHLDVQERMKVRIIPGPQLFPWMSRRSVWTVVRHQSDQRTKQTLYERTRGCRYESALVPLVKWSWRKLQTLTR